MFKGLFKRIQHLAAATVLLLLLLVVVEAWLRQTNPIRQAGFVDESRLSLQSFITASDCCHHQLIPKTQQTIGNTTYQVNQIGLRGKLPSQKAGQRILVLGGTEVFGFGLQEEETIPARMEQFLGAAGFPTEVLNGGIPGYSPLLSALHFDQRLHRLTPDVVLLYIDEDSLKFEGRHHQLTDEVDGQLVCPHPSAKRKQPTSSTFQWIQQSAIAERLLSALEQKDSRDVAEPNLKSLSFTMAEIHRRVTASGIPMIVCQSPELPTDCRKKVEACCRRFGFQMFSCDSAFGDFPQAEKLWNSPGQLSRYGAALYARSMVQWYLSSSRTMSTN